MNGTNVAGVFKSTTLKSTPVIRLPEKEEDTDKSGFVECIRVRETHEEVRMREIFQRSLRSTICIPGHI